MKKVKFDDDGRIRVGDYERGKVYEVDDKEADRLVKDKGFVLAEDGAPMRKLSGVPTADGPDRGVETRDGDFGTNTPENR